MQKANVENFHDKLREEPAVSWFRRTSSCGARQKEPSIALSRQKIDIPRARVVAFPGRWAPGLSVVGIAEEYASAQAICDPSRA